MNAFNADDFLKRLADYLTSVYRISGTLKNDLISAARQVVYLYQNIPMDRLKASCSEVVDQLYDALESNVPKKGIAELLLETNFARLITPIRVPTLATRQMGSIIRQFLWVMVSQVSSEQR